MFDRDVGFEIAGLHPAQAPVGDLRPKGLVVAPADPVAAPLGLGVGRERHRPTETVLPVGQQRVALRGQQRRLGAGLLAGSHVPEKLRVAARAETGQQFAAAALLRYERVLVNRRLEDDGGFLEENLRQLRGVGDVVEPSGALVGNLDHGLRPGVACDEHGADGNLVGAHAVH